jgi:hypothetical protein
VKPSARGSGLNVTSVSESPTHVVIASALGATRRVQLALAARKTLDPDVQQLLRDAMQRGRLSFKEALNQAIRSGLSRATNPSDDETAFVVRAQRMGLRAGLDVGRLNQMTDELEAESFDELSRTLSRTLAESARKQK